MRTDDLIGIPFATGGRTLSELDCAGLAQEVLRRAGMDAPDLPTVWEQDPDAAVERWGAAWEKVGDTWDSATLVGDVIVSDPGHLGRSVHLSVVASARPQRVLTTLLGKAVHAARPCPREDIVGVYRLKQTLDRVER